MRDDPRAPWRLLEDRPADGAANMARDEALLRAAARSGAPTLRLYAWVRPTLSLGAHQSSSDADLAACRSLGVDLVRRPTGGSAVLHDAELTYSVTGRLGEGVFPSSVVGLYGRISEALLHGLETMGVRGEASGADAREPGGRLDAGARRPREHPPHRAPANCFTTVSRREILVRGRKLIGSAQVRRGRAFLQHGSILLDWNPALLARVLSSAVHREGLPGVTGAESAAAARTAPGPVTLSEILGRALDPRDLAGAIVKGFTEKLGAELVTGTLDPREAEDAATLRAFKYLDARWTLDGRARPAPPEDAG